MIKLSPSILSADFTKLGEAIKVMEDNAVPYIHVDVMDGMFVPNISIGVPVVKSIRKVTDLILDVHLMIVQPERYIEAFANAGADIINIHYEACEDCEACLKKIRELGKSPAITIKPKTSYKEILPLMELVDMVLIMSVEPGFGGQSFIESTLENLEGISKYVKENNLKVEIEIDGGVTINNVERVVKSGANVIVAGSAVFNKPDVGLAIREFNEVFEKYEGGCDK